MKTRKKRKIVFIVIIVVLIIAIIAGVIISNVIKNNAGNESGNNVTQEENDENTYSLPNTTYSNMEVTNVVMNYLENNNETMVSMVINNTSDKEVSDKWLTAILMNNDGEVIGQLPTYISKLEVGKQCNISVVLKGNLTSTTVVRLQEQTETN